ncbi:hypothetical protein [Variovorax sp. HW608]|uniref:hypothetical protein n=1 Tax=Variovorax sp. HW608 TaxID=1034889 RepID=UPI0012FD08BE|nr:hypothetical protein [Variovorax sp. HW608]
MPGERIVRRVPIRLAHSISPVIFLVLRVAALIDRGRAANRRAGHILPHAPICSSLRALDKCS